MKSSLSKFVMVAMLVLLNSSVWADGAAEHITVSGAHARAVPPGQPNSASFMTIMNHTDQGRALVAASSPAAKVVELHTHTMNNGMMQMRRVDKIDLPAGEAVTLQPGGLHVMMIGLVRDLQPGDQVEVTLEFDDGSKKLVKAPVQKIKVKMGGMKHDMKKNMNH